MKERYNTSKVFKQRKQLICKLKFNAALCYMPGIYLKSSILCLCCVYCLLLLLLQCQHETLSFKSVVFYV